MNTYFSKCVLFPGLLEAAVFLAQPLFYFVHLMLEQFSSNALLNLKTLFLTTKSSWLTNLRIHC